MASSGPFCPVCGKALPAEPGSRCPGCETAFEPPQPVERADSTIEQPGSLPEHSNGRSTVWPPRSDETVDRPEATPSSAADTADYAPSEIGFSSADAEGTVDLWATEDGRARSSGGRRPAPASSGAKIGRFHIVAVLGKGSFGTVYKALDPLLDREVALKVPRFTSDDPDLHERFVREAKAAARLRHPNIVAVFESGETPEGPYIASEFVDGVPLSKMIANEGVDLRTAVDWVRQIADAIDYAHKEGIVHRDIKPANIMINRAGRPQVMDFGLAKRASDAAARMTIEGTVLGTPAYMAPEQARGELASLGPHSDQYSVGVVLYELLCGRIPFQGDSWSIMSQVGNVHTAPPALRSLRKEIPLDLEACCLKTLEKEAAGRYASLHELAHDLDSWLEGRPLKARPIGTLERLARWRRRNRTVAWLIGAVATLLLIAAIVGPILALQFRELAAVAKREAEDAKIARAKETAARLASDQLLIDTYTENGLAAAEKGDMRQAVLWFVNAAGRAENHPSREHFNRLRLQSWLSALAIPIRAYEPPGDWIKAMRYHASGRYLMTEAHAGTEIRDLRDGSIVPPPLKTAIHTAVWSPDGRLLVVASEREVAAFTFPEYKETDRWPHPDRVTHLAFSGDGKRLAVATQKSVQVHDIAGRDFVGPPIALESRSLALVINHDGGRLALLGEDYQVRVFSAADGRPLVKPQSAPNQGKDVPPVFLDNDRLVIVDSAKDVCCWDLEKAKPAWERKWNRCLAMAASPDRKRLALGEPFDAVMLDAATGAPIGKPIPHRNFTYDLAFSPDGKMLLSATEDHVRLSAVPSGDPLIATIPHNDVVNRCVWSPDGATFATVHWGRPLVRVWKLGRPEAHDYTVPLPTGNAFVKFGPKGKLFLASGTDTLRDARSIVAHDVRTGASLGHPYESPGRISDATFGGGGELILVAGSSGLENTGIAQQDLSRPGIVAFFDRSLGKAAFPNLATPSQPIAVQCSPDGSTAVVLCQNGELLLVDPATGKQRTQQQAFDKKPAHHSYVIRDRIRFSPLGDRFAIWGSGTQVEVRDTTSGELRFGLQPKGDFVHDVRFSPDGQQMVTCCSEGNAHLWNAVSGPPAGKPLGHSGWVFTAEFSRDGKRLLTACSDRQAYLWDLESRNPILTTAAQSDQVYAVCFLADDRQFLVGTRDGRVSAWDAELGMMIAPVRRLPEMVYQIALSSDGSRVLVCGRLNPMHSFELASWICAPDHRLHRADLPLLGEVLSAQRVHGAAVNLTRDQWFERWQQFASLYADHPLLRLPSDQNP